MFTFFLCKSKKRLYSKDCVRTSASGCQNITICFKHRGSAFAMSFKGSLRPQKSVIQTSAGFNPVLGSALKHYPTVARPGIQIVFRKVGSAMHFKRKICKVHYSDFGWIQSSFGLSPQTLPDCSTARHSYSVLESWLSHALQAEGYANIAQQ